MMLDEFGNVGFNESNRYFDDIPNDDILQKEKYYFPGTIFEIDIVIPDFRLEPKNIVLN